MAKTKAKKISEVEALTEKLKRMKVAVFTATAQLNVKDTTKLRAMLRDAGIDHTIAKKTLLRRALDAAGLQAIDLAPLTGSFAITLGYDDEVMPAKLLSQFAKTHETMTFFGGILDGSSLSSQQVSAMSKLLSRREMRGRMVGTLATPISGFVSVLIGTVRGFVRILDGYREQRAKQPS